MISYEINIDVMLLKLFFRRDIIVLPFIDVNTIIFFLHFYNIIKIKISILEIPEWLHNSQMYESLTEDINTIEKYSSEWFDEMSRIIDVKNFIETNNIDTIKSFWDVLKTSDFFNLNDSPQKNQFFIIFCLIKMSFSQNLCYNNDLVRLLNTRISEYINIPYRI